MSPPSLPPAPISTRNPLKRNPMIRHISFSRKLAAYLIYILVKSLSSTIRSRLIDPSGFFKGEVESPIIFALWHNRLALSMTIFHRYVRSKNLPRLAALVSASRDGGVLARVLQNFEVQPVRGSSSRRGAQALLELTSWIEKGYHAAITPDGPRGPCYSVQEGIIALAQISGAPIIATSLYLPWKIQLKSWDRFQIPLPFTRCEIRFSDPLYVPRNATPTEREQLRRELEKRLLDITMD
jgi:lysophospholipid acyltransferase (LPLAT)-like uncharacterized protein